MSEKVTVFIDGANLFHGLINDLKRTDLDYSKFVDSILNGVVKDLGINAKMRGEKGYDFILLLLGLDY